LADRAAWILARDDVDSNYGGVQPGAPGAAAVLLQRPAGGDREGEVDVAASLEGLDAEGILRTLKTSDLKGLRVRWGQG
jgi:hypothetical protein